MRQAESLPHWVESLLIFRPPTSLEASLGSPGGEVESDAKRETSGMETFDETSRRAMSALREATLRLHAAAAENEILRGSIKDAYRRIAYLEEAVRVLKNGRDGQ